MAPSQDREAQSLKHDADAHCRAGRFNDALPIYTQALGCAQDLELRSALLSNRCLALLRTAQAAAALEDALQALALRPRWHRAHMRVAQCREALGDPQAAITHYRRALELEPSLEETVGKALAALELRDSRSQCRLRLAGHRAAVYGLALHPQVITLGALRTRILATAGGDGTVRLWCTAAGTLLQTLKGHTDMVTAVEWSPCRRFLSSCSLDSTARLWEVDPAVAAQLGGDSAAVATAGGAVGEGCGASGSTCSGPQQQQGQQEGGFSQFQQAQQPAGAAQQLLRARAVLQGHTGRVFSLAFALVPLPSNAAAAAPASTTPEGAPADGAAAEAAAASSPAAGTASGAEAASGAGCAAAATTAGCTTSKKLVLATGSTDCTARLWAVATGQCLQVLKGHGGIITSLSFSPCGRLLATASGDTRCKVWDTASGVQLHDIAWDSGGVNLCGFLPQPPLHSPTPFTAVAGQEAAAQGGSGGSSSSSSSVGSGASAQLAPPLLLTAHIEPRRREGRVLLWDVGAGEEPFPPAPPRPAAASGEGGTGDSSSHSPGSTAGGGAHPPQEGAASSKGPITASAVDSSAATPAGGRENLPQNLSSEEQAGQAPAAAGAKQQKAQQQQPASAAAEAAAEGAAAPAPPATPAATPAPRGQPRPARKRAGWVDGKLIAPAQTIDGFRGKITSWDACLGPGGALLLATACGDGLARVYDLTSGVAPLFELSLEHSVHSAAAVQDVPAWSLASMQHAANARNLVSFSPDGRLLAVSGADCRVTIYEVEGSDAVRCLRGHSKSVRALVWSGEGELVSAGEDGAVNVWRAGG